MNRQLIFGVIAIVLLFAIGLSVPISLAPTDSPLPTPTPAAEEQPPFPDEVPPLPDELPERPQDLAPWLEVLLVFGVGYVIKFLTDQIKWLPYLTGVQQDFIRRRLVQLGWALVSVLTALIMPYFGIVADLAEQTGIWGVIVALLAVSAGAHRGDKLLKSLSSILMGAASAQNVKAKQQQVNIDNLTKYKTEPA